MALARNAVRRIGAAKRDILVKGDVIPDLRGFTDDREAMVDEEPLADTRAGMNVVSRQKTGEVIDRTRQKIKPRAIQPVRDPLKSKRPHPWIEEYFRP